MIPTPPVLGWRGDHQVVLKDSKKKLHLESLGQDPHISFSLESHLPQGKYSVELSMTSESAGNAQWFWQEVDRLPIYIKDRSVVFDVRHDGRPNEYAFSFVAESPVVSFRFDPSRGKGSMIIDKVEIKNAADETVLVWPR